MDTSRTLLVVAVVAMVALAGCTGIGDLTSSVTVEERGCGEILGAGGCRVTLANAGDTDTRVRVTVDAMVGDEVVASGAETTVVPAKGEETVVVEASAPGQSVTYEVTVEEAPRE